MTQKKTRLCRTTGLRGVKGKTEKPHPRILMIYTGGTIGMIENPDTGSLEPFDFEHLLENVPKLKLLDLDIESVEFEHPIDSSSMNPEHWKQIARVIEENYVKYDGFVVLHGTDTMAYTASALSFMLENLAKPVIITGSQLPIGDVRTDGEENLITALQIAGAKDAQGHPRVREVAIVFEDFLLRGNRSTKHSSDNFAAFSSNNFPPLAEIGLGIHYNKSEAPLDNSKSKFKVQYGMDTNVMYIDLFPGIQEGVVRHLFSTPGIKGIVMKTFGAGNGPNDPWFIQTLHEAVERGIVVVNISQCMNGSVMPELYSAGREISRSGVVSGRDMTSEAAITKLMHLFGCGYTAEEVAEMMKSSICGEMTAEDSLSY
ncbi:MAG: asparaginase [Muribaculaceae bacterium]|nr:asparaginase [Muribaculaceae bacterium]